MYLGEVIIAAGSLEYLKSRKLSALNIKRCDKPFRKLFLLCLPNLYDLCMYLPRTGAKHRPAVFGLYHGGERRMEFYRPFDRRGKLVCIDIISKLLEKSDIICCTLRISEALRVYPDLG